MNASFCSVCGNPLGDGPWQGATPIQEQKTKSGNTNLIVVIAVIVVVMMIGFAVYVGNRVADNLATSDVNMSVVDATEVIDPFWSPPDGSRFIQLTISMANNQGSSMTLNPFYFDVVTSDGSAYECTWQIDNTVPDSLAGKSSATFTIAYAIPIEKTPTKVTYLGMFDLDPIEAAIGSVNPPVVKITVTVSAVSVGVSDYAPDEGNKYVLIEFEMTNDYNETLELNPYDFQIQTTNGTVYDYSLWVECSLPDGLAAGATASMSLGFEIPISTVLQMLIYESGNLRVEATITE